MTTTVSDTFWADYINQAMTFAVLDAANPADKEKATNEAYFGLFEETGEVSGLFKRAARGDSGGELDYDKLAKELGDLLWYIVRVATIDSCPVEAIADDLLAFEEAAPKGRGVWHVRLQLGMISEAGMSRRIRAIFVVAKYVGLDMREVATKNLEKLRARRAAGTIQGSGDNR